MNCGTRVGFGQHKARNEPACRWCKEWFRKEQEGLVVVAPIKAPKSPKAPRKAKPKPEPRERKRPDCGSTAAFHQHVNRGEEVDEECRTAYRAYQREQYAKRQAKITKIVKPAREVMPCGTTAAARRHKYHGEPIDEACRLAVCADSAERYQRSQARKKAKAQA